MTRARYEIEFQERRRDDVGSLSLPLQAAGPAQAAGTYAPYQPRFEWNSGSPPSAREQSLGVAHRSAAAGERAVRARLFAGNPFAAAPPTAVRTVQWRYWFTRARTRRRARAGGGASSSASTRRRWARPSPHLCSGRLQPAGGHGHKPEHDGRLKPAVHGSAATSRPATPRFPPRHRHPHRPHVHERLCDRDRVAERT